MNLLIVISLLECFYFIKGQEIRSTGQHSSDEFVWAVDVDNLSFNISFTGISSSNYYYYIHDWSHISPGGETLVSFRVSFNVTSDGSLYGPICYNGNYIPNPPHATAHGIYYRITCTMTESTLESQFSIVSSLNSSYNGSMVKVQVIPPGLGIYTEELVLEYCKELLSEGKLKVVGGIDASYNTKAKYTCSNSSLVISDTYDDSVSEYSRTCQYDAKWSNPDSRLDCWFAPVTNISLAENNQQKDGFVNGAAVEIKCRIEAEGNPASTKIAYYINGNEISSTFVASSNKNGAQISCQVINDYVTQVNSSTGISPIITLNVLFQPEPPDENFTHQQSAGIGENYTIVIAFKANPVIALANTALYFDEKLLDPTNASISCNGTLQEYRYLIMSVEEADFGTYILSVASPSPQLPTKITSFFVMLNNTDEATVPTVKPVGLSSEAIVGISVGCVVFLIVVVILFVIWRRNTFSENAGPKKTNQELSQATYVNSEAMQNSAYEAVNQEVSGVRTSQNVEVSAAAPKSAYEVPIGQDARENIAWNMSQSGNNPAAMEESAYEAVGHETLGNIGVNTSRTGASGESTYASVI